MDSHLPGNPNSGQAYSMFLTRCYSSSIHPYPRDRPIPGEAYPKYRPLQAPKQAP
ncbi:hypothetical protein AMTRI_Chr04g189660 [Amborella trichopoda]